MNSASKAVENGGQRDGAEKGNVNPGEIAVGAGELIELRLLADPEDANGHYAHQKEKQPGRECDQHVPQIALGVHRVVGGNAEIEHEQCHGHGEDAVAEGGQAFDALSGNAVVKRVHPTTV